uniref:ATP synthase F0 subunit 6 n=1 Tax=Stethoconus japonicus TaxID=1929845 RepID=UPI0022F2B165|nr:ATP synthase F0 subunit 6 [Stethoconus japonicus]UFQ24459.1 ATP synthase F0 subunit 6 [Stethoconus japonicus]
MMTNLFSTFDPATTTSMTITKWMSTMMCLMLLPQMYWMMPSRMSMMSMKLVNMLNKEFKTLLSEKSSKESIMLITMFMFILYNNMMGLLPYMFTSSSHLVFSLSLSLPMWLGLMLFGWANKSQKMFAHLIPDGTPTPLMPFMVLIETTSNLIRPGSLAVRLTANMIAGHMLMSLLGNNMNNSTFIMMPLILMAQTMLMMFETAVSLIQAYVFSVLTTLYSSEVKYE